MKENQRKSINVSRKCSRKKTYMKSFVLSNGIGVFLFLTKFKHKLLREKKTYEDRWIAILLDRWVSYLNTRFEQSRRHHQALFDKCSTKFNESVIQVLETTKIRRMFVCGFVRTNSFVNKPNDFRIDRCIESFLLFLELDVLLWFYGGYLRSTSVIEYWWYASKFQWQLNYRKDAEIWTKRRKRQIKKTMLGEHDEWTNAFFESNECK